MSLPARRRYLFSLFTRVQSALSFFLIHSRRFVTVSPHPMLSQSGFVALMTSILFTGYLVHGIIRQKRNGAPQLDEDPKETEEKKPVGGAVAVAEAKEPQYTGCELAPTTIDSPSSPALALISPTSTSAQAIFHPSKAAEESTQEPRQDRKITPSSDVATPVGTVAESPPSMLLTTVDLDTQAPSPIFLSPQQLSIVDEPSSPGPFFPGASHFTISGGSFTSDRRQYVTYNNWTSHGRTEALGRIPGAPAIYVDSSSDPSGAEDSADIEIIAARDLRLISQEQVGPGYHIHSAELRRRAVIVKAFHPGPGARQQLERTVAFCRRLMHPNLLRINGVSSRLSLTQFIIYQDGNGGAERILASALDAEDIYASITLGFKLVACVSAGLDYLSTQGLPLSTIGIENFDVLVDGEGQFFIAFGPGQQEYNDVTMVDSDVNLHVDSWTILNSLCEKTLKSANRVAHDEEIDRNSSALDSFPFNSTLASPNPPGSLDASPRRSTEDVIVVLPPRREYVWRTLSCGQQPLSKIARRLDFDLERRISDLSRLALHDTQSPHRCPGYIREEIILATRTRDSAIVSHDAPSPSEICPVCNQVVGTNEMFNCVCGESNPGSGRTSKCRRCGKWCHSACAGAISQDGTCFLCIGFPSEQTENGDELSERTTEDGGPSGSLSMPAQNSDEMAGQTVERDHLASNDGFQVTETHINRDSDRIELNNLLAPLEQSSNTYTGGGGSSSHGARRTKHANGDQLNSQSPAQPPDPHERSTGSYTNGGGQGRGDGDGGRQSYINSESLPKESSGRHTGGGIHSGDGGSGWRWDGGGHGDRYRFELNTQAQRRGIWIQWSDTQSGPLNNATWGSTVYVNRVPYGTGSGSTKSSSREAAAKLALEYLAGGY